MGLWALQGQPAYGNTMPPLKVAGIYRTWCDTFVRPSAAVWSIMASCMHFYNIKLFFGVWRPPDHAPPQSYWYLPYLGKHWFAPLQPFGRSWPQVCIFTIETCFFLVLEAS